MPTALIIEDDKFLTTAYKVKLSKAGFEVTLAADGEEGLAALEKAIPDIIILDLVMPKKDGFDTLAEIKKNTKYQQIPIIVASNLGQKEDLDRAQQLGANDYIVKSDMSMDDIVTKVNALVGKGAAPAAAASPAPATDQPAAPAAAATPPAAPTKKAA